MFKNYILKCCIKLKSFFYKLQTWEMQFLIMALIVSVGILLRLGFLFFNHPIPSRDGVGYANMIAEWYHCGDFDVLGNRWLLKETFIPPFLLFIGKVMMQCGFSQYSGVLYLNMILGSLLPIIIFCCAKKLWPQYPGRAYIATLFTAIHPSIIAFSADLLRESSYIFFIACTFYFWLTMYKEKQCFPAIITGIMAALTTLCRYEGFELYPMLLITIITGIIMQEFKPRQGVFMMLSLVGGVLAAYLLFFFVAGIDLKFFMAWLGKILHYLKAA